MRLLQVTRHYVPEVIGGYERNCQRFSEEWARRGHQVAILTRQSPGLASRETIDGVEVFRALPDVPTNRHARGLASRLYQLQIGLANRRCWTATNHVLDAWRPDAVVFWGMNSWVISPILAVAKRHIPCMADLGDYWLAEALAMYAPESKRRAWYRRNVMLGGDFSPRMFDEVWVHSAYMQELYRQAGLALEVIRIIPRGLDERMTTQDPGPRAIHSGAIRILCVGRLVPDKGAHVLAKAFALLRQKREDVELHFYGDAWEWYRRDLERDCHGYGLLNNGIYIHDRVEPHEMQRIYLEHDVLAFPVLWNEPSSNVLLEAMAMRLPIVASRAGSNQEFVDHLVTGYLVPPDDGEALAACLQDLCADAGLRQKMGDAARRSVLLRHLQKNVFDETESRLLLRAQVDERVRIK